MSDLVLTPTSIRTGAGAYPSEAQIYELKRQLDALRALSEDESEQEGGDSVDWSFRVQVDVDYHTEIQMDRATRPQLNAMIHNTVFWIMWYSFHSDPPTGQHEIERWLSSRLPPLRLE